MPFDYAGAKQAGYNDEEIVGHLASSSKFDVDGARAAGYNPSEIAQHMATLPPDEKGQFGQIADELQRGAYRVGIDYPTLIKSFSDPEEAALTAIRKSEEVAERLGTPPSLEAALQAWKDEGAINAAGEVIGDLLPAIAGQLPTIATVVGGRYIGSTIGGVLGGMFGGPPGAALGSVAGGYLGPFVGLLPQLLSPNIQRQAQADIEAGREVDIDMTKAYMAATAQTATEQAAIGFMLGKRMVGGAVRSMLGRPIRRGVDKKAGEALRTLASRTLAGNVVRGAGAGASVELSQEISQQVMERWQAGLDLTSEEAFAEYGEAAYQAALVGGSIRGVTQGIEGKTITPPPDPAQLLEREQQLIEEEARRIDDMVEPPMEDDVALEAWAETYPRPDAAAVPTAEPVPEVDTTTRTLGPRELQVEAETLVRGTSPTRPLTFTSQVLADGSGYQITDQAGNRYGRPVSDMEMGQQLALRMNQVKADQQILNSANDSINLAAGTTPSTSTRKTLLSIGNRVLNPRYNKVTFRELNAAGVVGDPLAEDSRRLAIQNLPLEQAEYYLTQGPQHSRAKSRAEMLRIFTPTQRLNYKRRAKGQGETAVFTMAEARAALKDKFGNLANPQVITPKVQERARMEAPSIPISEREAGRQRKTKTLINEGLYRVSEGAPKTVSLADLTKLLLQKNISSPLNSPAMKPLIKAFTGASNASAMTEGDRRVLYKNLNRFQAFEQSTKIPLFTARPFSAEQFSAVVEAVNSTGNIKDSFVATAANITTDNTATIKALQQELRKQRVIVNNKVQAFDQQTAVQADLLLPAPEGYAEEQAATQAEATVRADRFKLLADLRTALNSYLDKRGLGDVKVRLDEAFEDAIAGNTQGFYDRDLRTVFFALDRIPDAASLTPEQLIASLENIMGHEMVHALRGMDLWTEAEWDSLVNATMQREKSDGETYMKWAVKNYPDKIPSIVEEEAVAEMIRDVIGGKSKVAGKPRNLIKRIFDFFERLVSYLKGSRFNTFEEMVDGIIADVESGVTGARERGVIRTPRRAIEEIESLGREPTTMMDARAWQGSPSKFDEMSTDYIGTGEGFQAYGWGLYFSQAPEVATGYQKRLSKNRLFRQTIYKTTSGEMFDPHGPNGLKNYDSLLTLDNTGGDVDATIERLERKLAIYDKHPTGRKRGLAGSTRYVIGAEEASARADLNILRRLKEEGGLVMDAGYLYDVDLKISEDHLLDWDVPLNRQTDVVKAKLEEARLWSESAEDRIKQLEGEKIALSKDRDPVTNRMVNERKWHDLSKEMEDIGLKQPLGMSGEAFYSRLVSTAGGNKVTRYEDAKKLASQLLNEAGIPGIRYYDASSRGAQEGTRNFVIFDDSLVEIKARNGEELTPAQREIAVEKMTGGERYSLNLAAETSSIAGIAELSKKAAAGDMEARRLLQDVAMQHLIYLLKGTGATVLPDYSTGIYKGVTEASISPTVEFNAAQKPRVLNALRKFAENFNQEQIHVRIPTTKLVGHRFEDGSYSTPVYRWTLDGPLDESLKQEVIDNSGIDGLTLGDTFLEIYYSGDITDGDSRRNFERGAERINGILGENSQEVRREAQRFWPYGRGEGAIEFGQIDGDLSADPQALNQVVEKVAAYLSDTGRVTPFYPQDIDENQQLLQEGIAADFESLPVNDLDNPLTRRAYEELSEELAQQFSSLPVKVEVFEGTGEPYANSREMRQDVLQNNHLYIYKTIPSTFGPEGMDFSSHPLLADSKFTDINGVPLLYNDLFRAVHDYLAHNISTAEFGPKGEEAAWKNHMAVTNSPWARWALTTETRGQNSWVNYRSDLAPDTPLPDRPFAEQKTALLPLHYSFVGDVTVDAPVLQLMSTLHDKGERYDRPSSFVTPTQPARDIVKQAEFDATMQRVGEDMDMEQTLVAALMAEAEQPSAVTADESKIADENRADTEADQRANKKIEAVNRLESRTGPPEVTRDVAYTQVANLAANRAEKGLGDFEDGQVSWETPTDAGKRFKKTGKAADFLIFQAQDKYLDLKRTEAAINEGRERAGLPPLNALQSVYKGEESIHGIIAKAFEDVEFDEMRPLLAKMAETGVDLREMDVFLILRHAIERNAHIRKINNELKGTAEYNPNLEDGGSGSLTIDGVKHRLTDDYVKSVMRNDYGMTWNDSTNRWEGGNSRGVSISNLAKDYDQMGRRTLDVYKDAGLISDKDADFLSSYYTYYAPLRGISPNEDIATDELIRERGYGSANLGIRGKELMTARGRESEAYGPLSTTYAERQRAIVRGAKNIHVGQRLLNLIRAHPNPDYWNITTEQKGGERIGVKENGIQYFVDIADPRLRGALLNLDAKQSGLIMGMARAVNRYLSLVNTSLNPEFVMGNFFRDLQTALGNLVGEQSMKGGLALDTKGLKRGIMKDVLPSIGQFLKGVRRSKNLKPEMQKLFDEYRRSGAKTDWYHARTPTESAKTIETLSQMAEGTFKGNTKARWGAVTNLVNDVNSAVENGVRFATFKKAKELFVKNGMSEKLAIAQAATLAKNLTVNFNRKGNSGELLNGLYLFFNASVQGTANFVRGIRSSRKKQALLAAMASWGALLTLLNEEFSDEDDETGRSYYDGIDDYQKERNMIFMKTMNPLYKGDPKDFYKIPLPYGYNVLHILGLNTMESLLGQKSQQEAATDIVAGAVGSFAPVGFSSSERGVVTRGAMAVVPQFFKPFAEILANENFFGAPIFRENMDFGTQLPRSSLSLKSTPEWLKTTTEFLNEISARDGHKYKAGAVNISPDQAAHFIRTFTGGTGKFIERSAKSIDALSDYARDEYREGDISINDIPILRRVMGEATSRESQSDYYDRRDDILTMYAYVRSDELKGAERTEYIAKNRDYLRMKGFIDAMDKRLAGINKRLRVVTERLLETPSMPITLRLQDEQERLEDLKTQVYDRFNKRFDALIGREK